jgi:DNA polymerase
MALDESMLDELGLGLLWVRRGTGRAGAVPPADADAVHEAAAAPSPHMPPARVAHEPGDAGQTRDAVEQAAQAAEEPAAPPPSSREAFELPTESAFDELPWIDEEPAVPAMPAARIEPASPDDIASLDWETLEARVSACERCRLCERRTNTVFGVGDRQADWMLIGEAPGENEDRLGEPFVGQAGKLLDNMLRSLSLARDSNVYIANVIKCRPPGNRNPEVDEVARCEPYLQRQVALVKPRLIVALGRFAAQSLLRTEASIASLRGRVHEYQGVPVIVTYHPAYLLRSLPDKAKAWSDLCLARKTYRESLEASGAVQDGR